MLLKRFYIPLGIILILITLISFSICFAQYTPYTTTGGYPLSSIYPYSYPYYQNSSYWPISSGNSTSLYNQGYTTALGGYLSSILNSYYGTSSLYPYSSLNTGSLSYPYNSPIFNPYGIQSNLTSLYYPGTSLTGNAGTTTSGSTNTSNGIYTAQANAFYPALYAGLSTALQYNPYALSGSSLSNAYVNPFSNYLPNQSYYQNPYASYPYNYGTAQYASNYYPYGYQANPYSQPLPYYQNPSSSTSTQSTIQNVNGTWVGTWYTTLSTGTVNNGNAAVSLVQNGVEINGNISMTQNSVQKISASIGGALSGTSINLTGALQSGTDIYTLTINGTVSGNNLSGTYSIATNSGAIVESGTYSLTRM